jgi:hypothetical protein
MLICEAVEPDGKTCSACGNFKSLDEYYKGSGKYGRRATCNTCSNERVNTYNRANPSRTRARVRKSALKTQYGLTPERFAEMWEEQGGQCASCADPLRRGSAGHAVDHCHATGRLRELLCMGCNTSLGAQKDDPVRLRKLADYLERHSVQP